MGASWWLSGAATPREQGWELWAAQGYGSGCLDWLLGFCLPGNGASGMVASSLAQLHSQQYRRWWHWGTGSSGSREEEPCVGLARQLGEWCQAALWDPSLGTSYRWVPCLPTEPEALMNGGRQVSERGCASHSSLVSSIEKDLQDIMDSLVLEEPASPSGKKPAARGQSPLSPVVNGGGRCLLSPPASPGAVSGGSSYENFSPLSSPASSSSYTSPSPSSQEQGLAGPPLVPLRSSSYNHAMQPPSQRLPPAPSGAPRDPWPAEKLGDHRAGSPRLTPRAAPRPRAALQERAPSPFREPREPLALSRQPTSRVVPETWLQPPESPRAARRNVESMRELPPLSPSLSRRAASPRTAPDAPSPQPRLGREVPGSPSARRKGLEELRGAGSPSPPLLAETPPRRPSFSSCLSPAYGLGSPAMPSPRQSPRTPRKPLGDPRPLVGVRERKNSITEISDNEDELLEYHRRQRQERVREQEMERLVSPRAGGCGAVVKAWDPLFANTFQLLLP